MLYVKALGNVFFPAACRILTNRGVGKKIWLAESSILLCLGV